MPKVLQYDSMIVYFLDMAMVIKSIVLVIVSADFGHEFKVWFV